MQVPKKLNWKVTAAVGTLAGVGLGGIVLAEPGREVPVPDGVILQQDPASLTRLSAPVVVPTTSARLAADAKVTTRTETRTSLPDQANDRARSAVTANTVTSDTVDSPPSPVTPASPATAPTPVSPPSPQTPPSPASPASPASPGS